MKILKYLLYFVVALIGLVLIVGLLSPSVSYGSEINVDKPIEEAWAVSQDDSKYAEWLLGFKSIELLTGEKGEVGSTYKVIVNPGEGQEDFEMTQTIASILENDHVKLDFDSDMMDFEQKILFSEEGGGTRIKTESTVSGKGIMMRAMFSMMEFFSGAFEKQEQSNMDSLKKLIDGNSTVY